MCERYVLPRQEDAEREFVPAQCWWKFVPSFNVSFPQYVPVLRRHDGAIEGVMMHKGLMPASAEAVPLPNELSYLDQKKHKQTPKTHKPKQTKQQNKQPMAGFY